jgi:hypothetical protein
MQVPLDPGYLSGAAVGQATPNAHYIGRRLEYEREAEASFDPVFNARLGVQMLRQSSLFFFVWITGGVLALVFFLILSVSLGTFTPLTVWGGAGWAVGTVLVIVFLVIPVPALLSEWKFLVDGKSAAGPVTFEHIYWALERRRTPLDSAQVRRLKVPGGEQPRDYLELRRGLFSGYISCFAQGADLYVGWTFWLRLSPGQLLLLSVSRIWHQVTDQRGNELYATLRYESAKAMRESMHSAAREGIDVATGQVAAQGQGVLQAVAVTTTELPA